MKPRSAMAMLLCTVVAVSGAAAGELSSMFGERGGELAIWPLTRGSLAAATTEPDTGSQTGDVEQLQPEPAQGKSPRRAFLLSALLPGAGELYAGSRIKGAVFMGIEAVAVGLWYAWNSEGNDLEDEFREMADAHWDPEKYLYWRELSSSIRYNSFTHALPCSTEVSGGNLGACGSSEKQQYYELLGKYDQFVAGWDDLKFADTGNPVQNVADFDSVETVHSERRLEYEDQRDESNTYLKRASQVTGLILVNHVLSAVDAARTAHAREAGVDEAVIERRTRLLVGMHAGARGTVPMLYALKPFD